MADTSSTDYRRAIVSTLTLMSPEVPAEPFNAAVEGLAFAGLMRDIWRPLGPRAVEQYVPERVKDVS